MNQNFNQKFNGVVWEHNEEHIQAWKDGRTGYPIVDAGMRAMKAQGYMHNRSDRAPLSQSSSRFLR
jgi:deoxyribodipyrimidine photo-lyase